MKIFSNSNYSVACQLLIILTWMFNLYMQLICYNKEKSTCVTDVTLRP